MSDILTLQEVDSTNSYATAHSAELPGWTVITADCQTAGRGQRGNVWESEEGANLTFSMIIKPENFAARLQFSLSEGIALAIVDTLRLHGIYALVKWPNDIYVGDRKICGILIEHIVTGMTITSSVAGVGLNVNQKEFRSDAPNPVSMTQITSETYDLKALLAELAENMEVRSLQAFTPEGRKELHETFKRNLWRGDGDFHPFAEPEGKPFDEKIADV